VIEVHSVTKRFFNITALDNVSLTIPRGEVVGILGPNGAGKTTLFKIMAGILNADAGRVEASSGMWPVIAYKPDRLLYPGNVRVRDYLEMIVKLSDHPQVNRAETVRDSLERVNLTGAADKRISDLSKGMRQRLGLAQTLIGDPSLLLLDEPSNGLDPAGQVEIQGEIRRLHAEGKTIVLSSHQLREVTAVCTYIVILSQGQIRYQNSMEAALALHPEVIIGTDRDVTPLQPWLNQLHPDITIGDRMVSLGEAAIEQRRHVLTLLLGAGYDITRLEYKRITLDEIYAEAVR
jgi:ABC-type multidrug transport system ATPase subunit